MNVQTIRKSASPADGLNTTAKVLSEKIIRGLLQKKKTVSTAESLTGGLLSAYLTDIPGASSALLGGIVSYTDAVKNRELGVSRETLDRYSAVSAETAYEMAEGVKEKIGSDFSVSCTGLAGPGGGEPGKPVGTVYIGISSAEKTEVFHCVFPEDASREQIRLLTAVTAFEKLLENFPL